MGYVNIFSSYRLLPAAVLLQMPMAMGTVYQLLVVHCQAVQGRTTAEPYFIKVSSVKIVTQQSTSSDSQSLSHSAVRVGQ